MLQPGFRDPVRESQSVFRIVMDAMARPGRIVPCSGDLSPPAPLLAPAAALLLTLCDFETPVWLDGPLAESDEACSFLRFHTGARLVQDPGAAAFAAIADPAHLPPLASFRQGTRDYPDRSTTIIVQVETLVPTGWTLKGPGMRDAVQFGATPLPGDFVSQLRINRAAFPCGVDILLATRAAVAALPRSTSVTETA